MVTALPPGFSIEAFAKDWREKHHPGHEGQGVGDFAGFGRALLAAIERARAEAGTKPWQGPVLDPRQYGAVAGAIWRTTGQLYGLGLPRMLKSAEHYSKPGPALELGLTPAQVEIGKLEAELFRAAIEYVDEAQRLQRRRSILVNAAEPTN